MPSQTCVPIPNQALTFGVGTWVLLALCSNTVNSPPFSLYAFVSSVGPGLQTAVPPTPHLKTSLAFLCFSFAHRQPGVLSAQEAFAEDKVCSALLTCPPAPAIKMANFQMFYIYVVQGKKK